MSSAVCSRHVLTTPAVHAGIECMVHETERAGHARDLVENLKLGDLQHLDGVVAVSRLHICPP